MNNQSKSKAWAWVPSLYFTEGLPYAFVMIVSVVLYKKLDISNSEIEKSVLEIDNVKKWVSKSDIKKIIIVPNKIINIVS